MSRVVDLVCFILLPQASQKGLSRGSDALAALYVISLSLGFLPSLSVVDGVYKLENYLALSCGESCAINIRRINAGKNS